jgi:hypothetical protein
MALSLAQAELYTQDKLYSGIVDVINKKSPLIARLPFEDLLGNALTINREDGDNRGSVSFRPINGTWTTSEAGISQVSFTLKILGEDADVDNFLQQTRSNVNDLMATQVRLKTKLMTEKLEDTLIYGDADVANEFDGIYEMLDSNQILVADDDATGAACTEALMDELLDTVTDADPSDTVILMNRSTRRRFSQYLRSVASYQTERDEYGAWTLLYNDFPVLVSDAMVDTELCDGDGVFSAKTGGETSSIIMAKLGSGDGLVGLQNGSITTEVFEKLETKDASRTRIKWYVGVALYTVKALAAIHNITDEAWTS